jgi:aspartyl protease family protein
MRLIILLYLIFEVTSCNHPESNTFSRDKKVSQTKTNILNNYNNNNSNILEMETENGVRYVWIEVNGIKLRFIFDTGASSICLSQVEATLLYKQGTLKREDIIGTEYFQDATGGISEGTKIKLRSVKVGELELKNVEATVINNVNAPLLLGQSLLEKFGSIEIDNNNNVIILK